MKGALHVLRFLLEAAYRGERTALVTITDITGGSPRAPGAHMAVSETGAHAGSLSGGCVEAAIIGEAKRVMQSGRAETLRLGEGSPFIDIQLPCGGGIDMLLTPAPDIEMVTKAASWLAARQPVLLELSVAGGLMARPAGPGDSIGWQAAKFRVRHQPDMQLIIGGNGPEALALARLGISYGAKILVLSPDQALVETATALGAQAERLASRRHAPRLSIDADTALVLLFHDHDWEAALLAQALAQPGFFIGAMGSRTTQARRLRNLAACGIPQAALRRLAGPIGLIAPARDPDTLALSALAHIVATYGESTARAMSHPALPSLAPA
jgi:xanthine dehydrogenase accessory factor